MPAGDGDEYGRSSLPLNTLVTAPNSPARGRPALVYFFSADRDGEKLDAQEEKMFANDDLAVASRFFTFFRINVDDLGAGDREEYAKTVPSFVFLDGEGKKVGHLKGAKPAKSLLASLNKLYRTTYKDNLQARLKLMSRYLNEWQKFEDRLAFASMDLAAREEAAAKRDSKANQKGLAKAKANIAECEAEMAKLDAEREEILSPPLRTPKGTNTN